MNYAKRARKNNYGRQKQAAEVERLTKKYTPLLQWKFQNLIKEKLRAINEESAKESMPEVQI